MKNQVNLDALFHKAGKQPVVSSFGETKELFLSTVGTTIVTVELEKTSFFTLKKLMIMLTILSSMAVAFFLIPDKKVTTIAASEPQVLDTPEVFFQQEPEAETKRQMIVGVNSEMQPIVVELTVKNSNVEVKLLKNPQKLAVPQKIDPPKVTTYKRPYSFPVLTAEQIEANNKRKKKMLKALSKFDKKSYAFVPSGTSIHNGDSTSVQSFYMQTTEVTNGEYRTFLFDLLIQGHKDDFLIAKPDQTLWTKEKNTGLKAMQDMYFSHEAYQDYPVNNISRVGAELYCLWLTKEVRKSGNKDSEKVNDVRIPLRSEWQLAATGEKPNAVYPWSSNEIINANGCFLANFDTRRYSGNIDSAVCSTSGDTLLFKDGAMLTAKVGSYNPNWNGIWCMSGNVAEMVYEGYSVENKKLIKLDPGTAGGGWMSSDSELKIFGKDPYKGLIDGHLNVGFRVVISYFNSDKNK